MDITQGELEFSGRASQDLAGVSHDRLGHQRPASSSYRAASRCRACSCPSGRNFARSGRPSGRCSSQSSSSSASPCSCPKCACTICDRGEHVDNPLELTLAGVQIAQLAVGVLGVLVITGEYATGMIRASMAAAPRRLPVLWAKLIVYGATVLTLMVPSAFIAFFIGHAILQPHHQAVAFGAHGVVRALVGAGLYLTVVGLFGLSLGAIVRNTAGGIARVRGDHVRAAAADERPADELEQRDLAVSAACRPANASCSSRAERSRRGKASRCCAATPPPRSSSPQSCSAVATSDAWRARALLRAAATRARPLDPCSVARARHAAATVVTLSEVSAAARVGQGFPDYGWIHETTSCRCRAADGAGRSLSRDARMPRFSRALAATAGVLISIGLVGVVAATLRKPGHAPTARHDRGIGRACPPAGRACPHGSGDAGWNAERSRCRTRRAHARRRTEASDAARRPLGERHLDERHSRRGRIG